MNVETTTMHSRAGDPLPLGGRPAKPTEEDALTRIPSPLMLAAARRVLADWEDTATDSTDWVSLADELASLTLDVIAATDRSKSKPRHGITSPIRHELLNLLRDELVDQWAEIGPPPEAKRVLEGFSQVEETLAPEPGSLESALSGPNGLELLAEIAHDLRSPLTSILTLAETLRRGRSGEVNELQRRQLGLIYSAALALSSTASDVVELAHGGDRLAQEQATPFSINRIMESICDIVNPMAQEKHLDVHFVVDASDRRLGYPLALSRVLLNLTTNALKFTDEGGVEMSAFAVGATRLQFSVRDSGRGISPNALTTLFQPFRRTAGRGYCFSGTGLGLAICRRLVEAMDSRLELDTRLNGGTRFYFKLECPPTGDLI